MSSMNLGCAESVAPTAPPSINKQQQQQQWQQQQWQQQQQQQAASANGLLSLQLPCGGSYVGELLRGASQQQVEYVLHMTAADWSAFFQQSFSQLVMLLELCVRDEYTEGPPQLPPQLLPSTSTSAPEDNRLRRPSRQSNPLRLSSAAAAAAAAAAAVRPGVSPTSDWHQVSLIVDEWVTLSALALLLNPMPVYMATTINHATQLLDTPPPGYWQSVVRRLKLTGWQVLNFHLALKELARLDKATVAQSEALAADAGCPNTLVLAAHAELRGSSGSSAAAAAAAADGGEAAAAAAAPAAAATTAAVQPEEVQVEMQGEDEEMPMMVEHRQQQQQQQQPSQAAEPLSCPAPSSSRTQDANWRSNSQQQQQQDATPDVQLHVKAEVMLQRKVQKLPLQAQLMLAFNCNTLTKMQLAQVLVSSEGCMSCCWSHEQAALVA
jgi:hypothetical protein